MIPKPGKISYLLSAPLVLAGVFVCSNVVLAKVNQQRSRVLGETTSAGSVLAETTNSPLSATKVTPEFVFNINVPANFSDNAKFSGTVEFLKDISAPNILYSLKAGKGVELGSDSQHPTITNTGVLSLQSRTGDLTLTSGDGISLDGLKITNTGILSLSAGTNISIDGNKITNTLEIPEPDYTLSGWTKTGTVVGLTAITDSVVVDSLTTGSLSSSNLTADNITLRNGRSIFPDTDLGSDLGSTNYRFNNLWVGSINSNSSQGFSGQTTFSYPPTDATITQASVLINPTTSAANGQLLGFGIAGYERALLDAEGDLILGYSGATSAPASGNPLSIFGHNATDVSHIDASGNAYFAGNVGVGTTAPTYSLETTGDGKFAGGTVYLGNASYKVNTGTSYLNVLSLASGRLIGSGGLSLEYNSGSVGIKIDTSGLVGIGTTSPSAALDIGSNFLITSAGSITKITGVSTAGLTNSTLNLVNNSGLAIIKNNASVGALSLEASSTVNSGNYIQFKTANSEQMRIDSSGNVGIGTISPGTINGTSFSAVKLHLTGAADAYGAVDAGSGVAGFILNDRSQSANSRMWAFTNYQTKFGISTMTDAGAISPIVTVDRTGNVGIGTTNPTYQLQTTGNVGVGGFIQMVNNGLIYGSSSNPYVSLGTGSGAAIGWNSTSSKAMFTQDLFQLSVGSSERMRVDVNGNVGIGTTNPISKLNIGSGVGFDANDALTINGDSNNENSIAFYGNGAEKWSIGNGIGSDPNFYIKRQNTAAMTVSYQNYVGIGTTSPSYLLDVAGKFQVNSALIPSTLLVTQNTNYPGYTQLGTTNLWLKATGNMILESADTAYGVRIWNNILGSQSDLQFNPGGVEKMRITSTGNVGIGTTNPVSKLHLSGAVTGKALAIFDETGDQALFTASASGVTKFVIDNNGNVGIGTTGPGIALDVVGEIRSSVSIRTSGIYLGASGRIEGQNNTANGILIDNYFAKPIRFVIAPDSTNLEVMRLTETGNVGIGTTGPTTKLQVDGSILANGNIWTGQTTNTGFFMDALNGYTSGFGSDSSSNPGIYVGGVQKLTVLQSNGNVGIGITNPGYKFTVNGQPAANGYTAFTNYSDARLKSNISTLSSGYLEKILKLNPSIFNYNSLTGYDQATLDRKVTGFIAQDLGVIFPEMVGKTTINGIEYLDTNLSALPVYLVKAIQEQQIKIDEITLSTASAKITNSEWSSLNSLVTEIKNTLAGVVSKLSLMSEKFVTKKSIQEELCIGSEDNKTCLTKEQVDKLMNLLPTPTATPSVVPVIPALTPTPVLTESPTPTPVVDPTPMASDSAITQ